MVKHDKLIKTMSIITIVGSGLFLIVTIIAMMIYPGGTKFNHYESRYVFLRNYFSDLGRTTTFLGESNLPTMILFATSLTIVGMALISYFSVIPLIFKENKKAFVLSLISSINGFVCAVFYIGIGYLPYDLYRTIHTNFVYIAFTGSLLTIFLGMLAIFLQKDYPNFYAWFYLVFLLILIGYLIILYAGPSSSTDFGLSVQVAGQKVIVYTEVISFAIQSIGTINYVRKSKKTLTTNINHTNI
ncbi:MAG: hypothetical protein ACTSXA_06295 [Candidatus Heimdallarchaeota archaeon]